MKTDTDKLIKKLSEYLPAHVHDVCKRYLYLYPEISEIRFRKNGPIAFTAGMKNISTDYICDEGTLKQCVEMLNRNAAYKNSDYILKGMIPLDYGFRAGIAGEMLISNGEPKAICSISSLNLRLPHVVPDFSLPLFEHLLSLPYSLRSTLVIAPPSGGKTTLLRDLAFKLSTPPVSERVCVVDTNHELSFFEDKPLCYIDFLSGYPIDMGIESATRYLNPQYIICDEIGNKCDIQALKNASFSGVAFIASAHAASYAEITNKPVFNDLIQSGIFHTIVTISNQNGNFDIKISLAQSLEVKNA